MRGVLIVSNTSNMLALVVLLVNVIIGNTFQMANVVLSSSNNKNSQLNTRSSAHGRSDIVMAVAAKYSFNPFTSRTRNSNIKWFESDLAAFYQYVEEQPRLTAEQELAYGKAVRMWTQTQQFRAQLEANSTTGSEFSDSELALEMGISTASLERMEKIAEAARSKLVDSNLKLVLAIVSRYRTVSIPNSELIAEGTRGLSKAVLRFDYTKGFRFATYATWYVHQAVAEYVRWRKNPTKMPSRYITLQRKVKQFTTDHQLATGMTPSVEQLAQGLGQSQFDITKVLAMNNYPTLLYSPVKFKDDSKDGSDRTLDEVLPSMFKEPAQQADSKDLRRDMEKMMQINLNDVERDILRLRLGLDDGRAKPIKEVGKRFKISWKQVRSVEKAALSKLLISDEINEFVDSYHTV